MRECGRKPPCMSELTIFINHLFPKLINMTDQTNNTPLADFDWDAYENGVAAGEKSREELTKTYDESLGTVKDKEVIEGTISPSTSVRLWSTSVTRATVSSL